MIIKAHLISIVTITKNNFDGFERTKNSIYTQSFRDFEWIIIDGNSTDGTKNHLPQNAISEPDLGIYDAMNKGIARASGDYILFLNAGDTLSDTDILATIAKTVKAENPDFLYGDALETGGFYKKARDHGTMQWCMCTHHQSMLYRRDIIGTLRYGTSYTIAADYAFTYAFLKNAKNISYIPAAICIFETGGISQRNMHTGRIEQYKARKNAGYRTFKNIGVYGLQAIAAAVKTKMPAFYARLRSGA